MWSISVVQGGGKLVALHDGDGGGRLVYMKRNRYCKIENACCSKYFKSYCIVPAYTTYCCCV